MPTRGKLGRHGGDLSHHMRRFLQHLRCGEAKHGVSGRHQNVLPDTVAVKGVLVAVKSVTVNLDDEPQVCVE
jgi:hypothetical protein